MSLGFTSAKHQSLQRQCSRRRTSDCHRVPAEIPSWYALLCEVANFINHGGVERTRKNGSGNSVVMAGSPELPAATRCSCSYLGCPSVALHHIISCIVQIEPVPALARRRSTLTRISDLYYAVAVRRPSSQFRSAAVCMSVPWFCRGAYIRCISTRTVAAWLPAHTAI